MLDKRSADVRDPKADLIALHKDIYLDVKLLKMGESESWSQKPTAADERVFSPPSRRMPTANADDPFRSEAV